MITWRLDPIDPIVARDGRPFGFGAGNIMRCLDWIYPSVAAGTARTLLGKTSAISEPFQDPHFLKKLKNIQVKGPFPFDLKSNSFFFPAPKDLFLQETNGRRELLPLRPTLLGEGEGVDIPAGLVPVDIPSDAKPITGPAFWSAQRMVEWLSGRQTSDWIIPEQGNSNDFLHAFPKELRTHLQVNPRTFTAEEQMLFVSEGLAIPPGIPLALGVDSQDAEFQQQAAVIRRAHGLGGDHRQVLFSSISAESAWVCPNDILIALKNTTQVRLVLVTPGLFSGGWRPGWIDPATLEGTPFPHPTDNHFRLKLMAAIVDRWRPISGWSLEKLPETGKPGPKAVRRIVPAGSVYFFKVVKGDPQMVKSLWLESVCDEPQDRQDGFGLSLWGKW